jgi:phosphatidylinositol-3-phosphatase
MEDMGQPCQHPNLNQPDDQIGARPGDQYVTRHNPFVYFHSIINNQARCADHVLPLTELDIDLSKVATTPTFVFISPNVCDDGHDGPSELCPDGYLKSADVFLRKWVPKILTSPSYRQGGMLIITFDEAETADGTSCCDEPPGPNVKQPGLSGPGDRSGGGRTGALILSRHVRAGSTNATPYNHYALLRGLEDLFGLNHLGYARQAEPTPLDEFLNQQP